MDLRTAAKHALAVADQLVPVPVGVTILIYHRVGGGTDSQVDLDVATFRAHLEHLREHHDVIDFDTLVSRLGSVGPATPSVVITFDDGTADFTEHVVPLLVEVGLPATVFVATDFVERGVAFPWGAPPVTWTDLSDAAGTGLVTVASHTNSHALLDRVTAAVAADELDRSIDLIAEHLGAPPAHFAYPKALPGSAAVELEVRSRFATAAIARSRVNRAGRADLHRLTRTPVQRSDAPELFARKAAGGLRLEGEFRALAAKLRYRSAVT